MRSGHLIVAVMLLGVVSAQPSPAQTVANHWTAADRTSATYRDESGVYHYPFEPSELPGAVITVQDGTVEGDGCTFAGSSSGSAGSTDRPLRSPARSAPIRARAPANSPSQPTTDRLCPVHTQRDLRNRPMQRSLRPRTKTVRRGIGIPMSGSRRSTSRIRSS